MTAPGLVARGKGGGTGGGGGGIISDVEAIAVVPFGKAKLGVPLASGAGGGGCQAGAGGGGASGCKSTPRGWALSAVTGASAGL
jgi:hypothetical protein